MRGGGHADVHRPTTSAADFPGGRFPGRVISIIDMFGGQKNAGRINSVRHSTRSFVLGGHLNSWNSGYGSRFGKTENKKSKFLFVKPRLLYDGTEQTTPMEPICLPLSENARYVVVMVNGLRIATR